MPLPALPQRDRLTFSYFASPVTSRMMYGIALDLLTGRCSLCQLAGDCLDRGEEPGCTLAMPFASNDAESGDLFSMQAPGEDQERGPSRLGRPGRLGFRDDVIEYHTGVMPAPNRILKACEPPDQRTESVDGAGEGLETVADSFGGDSRPMRGSLVVVRANVTHRLGKPRRVAA